MIIQFPDRDFSDVVVEFDTDMYTAVYVNATKGTRELCRLNRQAWIERLKEWKIDITTLTADYAVDEGL